MRIENIRIENFRAFKDVEIKKLSKMCVFIGPNGSGKSTLFDVFSFLCDALQNNVTIAINKRGGFVELLTREADPNKDKIFFEIRFRNKSKSKESTPLITYSLEIAC